MPHLVLDKFCGNYHEVYLTWCQEFFVQPFKNTIFFVELERSCQSKRHVCTHSLHVFKYPFCSLPTLNKLNIRNVSDKYVRFFSRGLYPVSDHIITVRIMKKNQVTKKQNQNSELLPFLLVKKSKYIKKRKKFIPLRFSVLLA